MKRIVILLSYLIISTNVVSQTVPLYQVSSDWTIIDSVALWLNNDWYYNDLITFYPSAGECIRARQDVVNGEKYKDWQYLPDVTNHHVLTSQDASKIRNDNTCGAHFVEVDNSVLIKNAIDNSSFTLGGLIQFKDPWFVDYTDPDYNYTPRNRGFSAINHEKTSPLNPNSNSSGLGSEYKGIFLNQNEYFNQNLPIYSVKSFTEQDIDVHNENVTWYFQKWDGTNVDFKDDEQTETQIVFQQPNAEARAVYKGHLASNHSYATGYNNGRKVAVDTQGKYHLVYEDNGRIWYTYSTNDGSTW